MLWADSLDATHARRVHDRTYYGAAHNATHHFYTHHTRLLSHAIAFNVALAINTWNALAEIDLATISEEDSDADSVGGD